MISSGDVHRRRCQFMDRAKYDIKSGGIGGGGGGEKAMKTKHRTKSGKMSVGELYVVLVSKSDDDGDVETLITALQRC